MVLIVLGESHTHTHTHTHTHIHVSSDSSPGLLVAAVFAMFGMLSPASRGALMTTSIVLFMFMG